MNNPVTSVRETDGEKSPGSMSSCLWHAKELVHRVTASFCSCLTPPHPPSSSPNIPSHTYTIRIHKYRLSTLSQAYYFAPIHIPSLTISHPSKDRMPSDIWQTRQHFILLSLCRQPACRDPNITLSKLNLELNEPLNQTQETPLIFAGHDVSNGCSGPRSRNLNIRKKDITNKAGHFFLKHQLLFI